MTYICDFFKWDLCYCKISSNFIDVTNACSSAVISYICLPVFPLLCQAVTALFASSIAIKAILVCSFDGALMNLMSDQIQSTVHTSFNKNKSPLL